MSNWTPYFQCGGEMSWDRDKLKGNNLSGIRDAELYNYLIGHGYLKLYSTR